MYSLDSNYNQYSHNSFKNKEEELINRIKRVYFDAMNDFQKCSTHLKSYKFDNDSKENILLDLNNSINGSIIKLKSFQNSFPKGKHALFSKTINDLLQDSLQIDSYHESLSEPFERFKLVLKSKTDIMIEEPKKSDNFPLQKQSQMKEVQQLLNMIKDTYDRAIVAFNSCIESLQTQNLDFYHQAQDLDLIIDTTSLQLRTIVEKFPQDFYQYLTMTFENMFQDFTKFKNAMPRKEREEKLVRLILRFEQAILLDNLMQKVAGTEKFEYEETHRKEKSKKTPGISSIQKRYDEVKKSMLKCIALLKKNNNEKSFYNEKGNLLQLIKKAEEQFESIQGQQFSSKDRKILTEIQCDWDSVRKDVSQVQRLSDEYLKFSRTLTKFINKL